MNCFFVVITVISCLATKAFAGLENFSVDGFRVGQIYTEVLKLSRRLLKMPDRGSDTAIGVPCKEHADYIPKEPGATKGFVEFDIAMPAIHSLPSYFTCEITDLPSKYPKARYFTVRIGLSREWTPKPGVPWFQLESEAVTREPRVISIEATTQSRIRTEGFEKLLTTSLGKPNKKSPDMVWNRGNWFARYTRRFSPNEAELVLSSTLQLHQVFWSWQITLTQPTG
jgi:hypothetical protein